MKPDIYFQVKTFEDVLKYWTGCHIGVRDYWWYLNKEIWCGEQCLWDKDRWFSALSGVDLDRHNRNEWNMRFTVADLNGDGFVDAEEFYTWFAKGWIAYKDLTIPEAWIKYY